MDEDKQADRHLALSIGLGVAALLIWVMFVLIDDAKVYLAAGVTTTVAAAMFRVLVAVSAVERRLERALPTGPTTPGPGA